MGSIDPQAQTIDEDLLKFVIDHQPHYPDFYRGMVTVVLSGFYSDWFAWFNDALQDNGDWTRAVSAGDNEMLKRVAYETIFSEPNIRGDYLKAKDQSNGKA